MIDEANETSSEPVSEPVDTVNPQVSASTAHVHGLIQQLQQEWAQIEAKFTKAVEDLRAHL